METRTLKCKLTPMQLDERRDKLAGQVEMGYSLDPIPARGAADECRRFIIPGDPVGKGRPRFTSPKVGRPRAYTPPRTARWEGMAAAVLQQEWNQSALDEPVVVDVVAVFQRPRRLDGRNKPTGRVPHTIKPDKDNVEKAVLDALKNAGVLRDDCRAYDGRSAKFYAAAGEVPHVEVTLWTVR